MFTSIAAYHFVAIDAPEALAGQVSAWAQASHLLGSVLVAGEGINLFLAGEADAIDVFLARLRGDARFAVIAVKSSRSATRPFARLKVRSIRRLWRDRIARSPEPPQRVIPAKAGVRGRACDMR